MTERLVEFARALRKQGISVGTGGVADFVAGAELADDVYWAGRATLLHAPTQVAAYDELFAEFFGGVPRASAEQEKDGAGIEAEVSLRRGSGASPHELFGRMPVRARGEAAPLAIEPLLRRTRRRRRSRRDEVDMRRTLRLSARTDGEPIRRARRTRRLAPRRTVLLVDISGSMSSYAHRLLVAAHAGIREHRRLEVFCFATRLTRLTHTLSHRDVDTALRLAATELTDWDGGTMIGKSIRQFLDEYGHAGMARNALVVICSDGFDVGESELLGEQMARLSRLAYRTVWLNPLLELESYEPRSAAMRAALPHVDVFAAMSARG